MTNEEIRQIAYRKTMAEFGGLTLSSDEIHTFAKERTVRFKTTKKNKVKEQPVIVPKNQINMFYET